MATLLVINSLTHWQHSHIQYFYTKTNYRIRVGHYGHRDIYILFLLFNCVKIIIGELLSIYLLKAISKRLTLSKTYLKILIGTQIPTYIIELHFSRYPFFKILAYIVCFSKIFRILMKLYINILLRSVNKSWRVQRHLTNAGRYHKIKYRTSQLL